MQNSNRLNHIVLSLIDYWYLWVVPCLLGFCLSVFYSLFLHTPTYTARQSLIVRDDLMGDSFKPSRFESLDSMKSAQETILEIARKPEVIRNVMEKLGVKRSSFFGSGGVSDNDIEEMQGNIEFGAPNGAEFGRTEAVVLKVTANTRDEAKKFTDLLLDEIDSKLSDVRRQRLNSMERELSLASESTKMLLQQSSDQLQAIERGFGTEITTIRELNDPQAGNSFDQKLNQIRQEKRDAVSALVSAREQKILLENALANDSLVTSKQLLDMQPALSVMMGSLNTARQQLSIDEGRYKSLHPALQASRDAVRHQEEMLFKSLEPTIVGVDSQIAMAEAKVGRLDQSISELEGKLLSLTEQRVPYAKLQEDVMNKTKVHSEVQAKLSQIRSYTSSAENIGLLTRVGEPQVGSRPNGLGKTALVTVGLAGGLLIGLGLVALAVPPSGTALAYQPVMMPVGGAPMMPVPNSSRQGTSEGSSSAARSTSAQSVAAEVNETVSELRLKTHAQQEQYRKQASATAASASSVESDAKDSVLPDSIAGHIAQLKSKAKAILTPTTSPDQQANESTSEPRTKLSSDDVISAFKAAQTRPAAKTGAARPSASSSATSAKPALPTAMPKPEKTPSQSLDSVQQQLRELGGSEDEDKREEQLRSLDPTISQTDVGLKRKKTIAPDVPDSVAAGRITAKSLIESSSARRVQGQNPQDADSFTNQAQQSTPGTTVDASILQRVKAELEDPTKKTSASGSLNRTSSISDYARSLEDAPAKQTTGELQDPSDSTLSMERRPSNLRPVDIAKSLAEHDSVRGIVDDIRPSEAESISTQIANQRTTEGTSPSKLLDNSLVGLMREARNSDPEVLRQKSNDDISAEDLRPTSKTQVNPAAAPKTKPQSDSNAGSEPIPQQISKLSDSISSFARPTGDSSGPEE